MNEEKKLTDEEIVKALEHCSHNRSCEYCYHNDEAGSGEIVCRARLMVKVLDLINRLQGEVQRLAKVEMEFIGKIADQKAEIERLTEEKDKYQEKWQTAYMNELNLQKQVDELNKKIIARESVFNNLVIVEKDKSVKITAKEIFILAEDYNCGEKDDIDNFMLALKERYGVEVE